MKLDMSIPGIKKYYIGFGVFGLVIVALTIFTLTLAGSAKQDKQTSTKAQEVANKLNDYVRKNSRIPDDLAELDVADIPSTIEYSKKSDSQYEFCVTFKTASSYSSPDLTSAVTGPLFGGYGGSSLNDYYADQEVSSYKPSSLYISSYSHKKGRDCQTIEPYIFSSFSGNSFSSGSGSSSGVTSAARDSERKADINSLHGLIEAHYAQVGRYPTLANINSTIWRSTNMRGLDAETLKDPQGTSSSLVATSTSKYAYVYLAYGQGGISSPCDNVNTDCAQYTLSATLSNGTTYTKSNLN